MTHQEIKNYIFMSLNVVYSSNKLLNFLKT